MRHTVSRRQGAVLHCAQAKKTPVSGDTTTRRSVLMRVHTMRKIDYFVGIPLCFLASIVQKVLNFFQGMQPISPHKVLFIELSEMGSTILADPAMQKLKTATGADLYFLIFERCKESLRLLPTVPAPHVCTLRETNLF